MTDEGRRKLSELMRARWEDPASREPLIDGIRKTKRAEHLPEETKAKISASRTARWRDEESRAKQVKAQSAGQKAAWADPEKRAARVAKRRATIARKSAELTTPPEPTISALPRTATGAIDVNPR